MFSSASFAVASFDTQSFEIENTTPDAFFFASQASVALSSVITSASVTISGIDTAAAVSVVNGTYSINGGAYTASSGTVDEGDEVTLRHTSSAEFYTSVTTTLTIGGVSGSFTSTTLFDGTIIPPRSRTIRAGGLVGRNL